MNKLLLSLLIIMSPVFAGDEFRKVSMSENASNKSRILSFFGPPGCGKGTIAQRCVKELGYVMLSTGDLARKHIHEGSDLGLKLKSYVNKGHMIPDELIADMVFDWMKAQIGPDKTVILDGFPRTKGQADLLLQVLKEAPEFDGVGFKVVNFYLSEAEIVKRISSRLVCSNKKCQEVYSKLVKNPAQEGICDLCGSEVVRRPDDEPEVVTERLKVFGKYANDLLGFYKDSGAVVIEFSVPLGDPTVVYEAFLKVV